MKLNFKKFNSLIPAIVQDSNTNQILMLGFMNQRAWEITQKTKRVTFCSRTKKRLWTKGESSGNYLILINAKTDCDQDTLLLKVQPQGPTCHQKKYSCFGEKQTQSLNFLMTLLTVIKRRKNKLPANSYTASLFKKGSSKILAKVKEEADEVIRAARNEGQERLIEEIGDLLYHLEVLMVDKKIEWKEIINCLEARQK
ncbi:MAG: hypothetical protein A2445_00175 [Candidatus Jacksonbacteria bacterium RIFOXYC2_FULL_44_29]|nr:MAG: Phosphoribosyl-AMP cyclohydrolase [Parcubacteria group bacterium GW2011_GWA2_42_28]KKT54709.1 MAG: Phosphoribosyl-AMP cyclohydrolase [Parcubacteria group bacterium GW2011_GWC2_44_22]OGY75308.1 MAG: hypothetical protein A2240_01685 [Candidatus Jacksonbacteria bacterium RIFOXYA2_FULL_43_12]OGY76218.1 MAG: hypothetical protein A2295_05770 [Candidatus Jacksonbacteria bacterium RIFOXYB2_FULL_44_15]OGY78073.1 MAG: hypothetical protein A2445_00175 [Candidatus Jacksonbacteria bacterium RIFOXYC2